MLGAFRTKGKNPESGLPNVVAIMLSEELGISTIGGALASGVVLRFGNLAPFDRSQWEQIATAEEVTEHIRKKEDSHG